ncbi:MAG: histidine ammonia-lyase [Deltaproteobacteria bacterium]|nr:histidine ammonia-lyase [Deltaproteobacteria bacterium]
MKKIVLDGSALKLHVLKTFLTNDVAIELSDKSRQGLVEVRTFIDRKLQDGGTYYGINTGFGRLARERISHDDLLTLQHNIVVSHAAGVGEPFSSTTSRLIMLLRANCLAAGYSGISPETLDLLLSLLNHHITPIIPSKGSVSASGDLAPLAHIALSLLGKGTCRFQEKIVSTSEALKACNLRPVTLKPKEGLALVNGTQATLAVAVQALITAEHLSTIADIAGALSLEADRASLTPFDPRLQALRPQPGQLQTAENILRFTADSSIMKGHAHCSRVQDPYSFRCIPQVHGAVKDALDHVRKVVEAELGSITDNPILFPDTDEIISGGNFHAEPLGFAMDFLSIAFTKLGAMSERRVAILLNPLDDELPSRFLTPAPGLNSGYMIPHVTMSALVSENKSLSYPASVDSIPTSGNQEDHVSMGLIAAKKAMTILENVERIFAIELLAACQAIDLQQEKQRPGKVTGAVYDYIRQHVPFAEKDREFGVDMAMVLHLMQTGRILDCSEAHRLHHRHPLF